MGVFRMLECPSVIRIPLGKYSLPRLRTLINVILYSFTYHLYNLIAVANYYHYTGDVTYLQSVWSHFTRGLAWSLSFIDDSGLMNVTASAVSISHGLLNFPGILSLPSSQILISKIRIGYELEWAAT